jgi:hypothetical protein
MINIDADGAEEISHGLEQILLIDDEFQYLVSKGKYEDACSRVSVLLQDMLDNIVV